VAVVHDLYGLRENIRWRGTATGILRYLVNDRLLAWARPQSVVTCSAATAAAVLRLLQVPVTVAPPSVDHVPDGPGPSRDASQILFVGRLVPSKGVLHAARAVELVRSRVPAARLRVIGDGPQRGLLPADVEVSSALEDGELDRVYRSSAVLLLPSCREGWGLVLTEAAARGVPYVAYDIPAVREQNEMLGGGVLVPPGAIEQLATALLGLMEDPGYRADLGAAGRRNARRELRWSGTAAAVDRTLRDAIGRGHR
jgi:glycosyltransferase involved in cell wall biosynthesis